MTKAADKVTRRRTRASPSTELTLFAIITLSIVLAEADLPNTRLIVDFDRAPLFGIAVGHFSPIGGFDPANGLVTLLDVTEGYGFSLVPARRLFEATRAEDPVSGQSRGLLRIVDPMRLSTPGG
jgi:hypothetical protein